MLYEAGCRAQTANEATFFVRSATPRPIGTSRISPYSSLFWKYIIAPCFTAVNDFANFYLANILKNGFKSFGERKQ